MKSVEKNQSSFLRNSLSNKKGFASIEATVLAVIFIVMIYYTFGFFGVVHTALLHNIHSRTYAFETFRHRSNLMYFRSNNLSSNVFHYYDIGTRLHGINTDARGSSGNSLVSTERPITMGMEQAEEGRRVSIHNRDTQRIPASGRNQSVAVNPVWIMTLYGMCLNLRCGG